MDEKRSGENLVITKKKRKIILRSFKYQVLVLITSNSTVLKYTPKGYFVRATAKVLRFGEGYRIHYTTVCKYKYDLTVEISCRGKKETKRKQTWHISREKSTGLTEREYKSVVSCASSDKNKYGKEVLLIVYIWPGRREPDDEHSPAS